jgi:hypothetical protein
LSGPRKKIDVSCSSLLPSLISIFLAFLLTGIRSDKYNGKPLKKPVKKSKYETIIKQEVIDE